MVLEALRRLTYGLAMQSTVAVIVTSFLLLGCAAPQAQIGAPGKVLVVDDRFQPFREYWSGPVFVKRYQLAMGLTLIGRMDRKTGAISAHLKAELIYMDARRRRYHLARNDRAEVLRLTRLTAGGSCKNGNPCPHNEVFMVDIPMNQLRQAPADGYRLKLFAKAGESIAIRISKPRVKSLLARIDADSAARQRQ